MGLAAHWLLARHQRSATASDGWAGARGRTSDRQHGLGLGPARRATAASPPRNCREELVQRSVFLEQSVANNEAVVMMPPQAPIRHYRFANYTSDYTLYNTDGDLFRVTCLEKPAQREALYHVNIHYNAQGFRQTTAGPADLVVMGDSFTMAAWQP